MSPKHGCLREKDFKSTPSILSLVFVCSFFFFVIFSLENKKAEYFGYIGEKEMWGRGIGKKMVGYILIYAKEAGLKEVYLHVAEDNERAIQLYQKMGFEMIGKREDVLKMKMNC